VVPYVETIQNLCELLLLQRIATLLMNIDNKVLSKSGKITATNIITYLSI